MTQVKVTRNDDVFKTIAGNQIKIDGVYQLAESNLNPENIGNIYIFCSTAAPEKMLSLNRPGMYRVLNRGDYYIPVKSMEITDITLETA